MDKFILKTIKIKNFKGIKNAKIDFEDEKTVLKAPNHSGKTSIRNAFEWCLCQNINDFLPKIDNKEIYDLVTSVEVFLTINGTEYALVVMNAPVNAYQSTHVLDTYKVLEYVKDYMYLDDGAQIVDVKEDDDKLEIPPMIIINRNGGTNYETRELGTLYSRMERFNPDEVLYVVDNRQALHFEMLVFKIIFSSLQLYLA